MAAKSIIGSEALFNSLKLFALTFPAIVLYIQIIKGRVESKSFNSHGSYLQWSLGASEIALLFLCVAATATLLMLYLVNPPKTLLLHLGRISALSAFGSYLAWFTSISLNAIAVLTSMPKPTIVQKARDLL